MQNAASEASTRSGSRNDNYNSIVSDLTSLITQVRTSLKLIEAAIAGEAPLGNQEISANVVVLDDVTPCYVEANAALNTCRASLGVALHFLMDTGTANREANQFAECGSRATHPTSRA